MVVVADNQFQPYSAANDTQSQSAVVAMSNKLCFTAAPSFCYILAPITATIAIVGIVCNIRTFLSTIRDKPWGYRLSHYVQALCLWDTGLLIAVLAIKALVCLYIKHTSMHLWSPMESFLALSLDPLIDICVTGSTWVMVSITVERYMAVSQPLRERTRNENSVKWFSAAVVILALTINLPRNLLEYHMSDCLHTRNVDDSQPEFDHDAVRFYTLVGRIIPDLLFRSPTPILLSIFLTIKIVKHCGDRLSRKEHSNLLPNASNDSGVHSTCSRTDHIKSPLLLVILNGKFLVCSITYVAATTIQWLDFDTVSDPSSGVVQTLKEFSSLLLVIHSATNWIFFRKWQPSLERHESVPDYEIFNKEEKQRLTTIWAKINVTELGTELLLMLIENNPSHIKQICPYIEEPHFDREELRKQPRVCMVGLRIGQFIERMMTTLNNDKMTRDDFVQIRAELRSIGIVHFMERVKLTSRDWFLTKRFLVEMMLEQSEKAGSNEDKNVANKFASFIIHEMKNGYVCESARVIHQTNSLASERDQLGSGRASPMSAAPVHFQRGERQFSCPSIYSVKDLTILSAPTLPTLSKASSVVNTVHDYITAIDSRSDIDDVVFV